MSGIAPERGHHVPKIKAGASQGKQQEAGREREGRGRGGLETVEHQADLRAGRDSKGKHWR